MIMEECRVQRIVNSGRVECHETVTEDQSGAGRGDDFVCLIGKPPHGRVTPACPARYIIATFRATWGAGWWPRLIWRIGGERRVAACHTLVTCLPFDCHRDRPCLGGC